MLQPDKLAITRMAAWYQWLLIKLQLSSFQVLKRRAQLGIDGTHL
jgi:hypothetical protein